VSYPELHDLSGDPFGEIRAQVAVAAHAAGLEHLDLYESVRGQPERALWVTLEDAHPNGSADAIFAGAIRDYLSPAKAVRR
jgi:hypothetical protein